MEFVLVFFFALAVEITKGLVIDPKCIDTAKLDLCNKYFKDSTYTCYKTIAPHYNPVSF